METRRIEVHHDAVHNGLISAVGEYPNMTDMEGTPLDQHLQRTLHVAEYGQRIIDQEVLCCQSALVDGILNAETHNLFDYGDIENFYPDPSEWTLDECLDYIAQNFPGPPDKDDGLEEMRETIQQNAEPAEILEWWLITPWLCRKLRGIGECVIDNDYGYWWGRTCSGQSIKLDPTFYTIAEGMMDD